MKKVLFLTVKVVPYRTRFFNLLSKSCDLTVSYDNADLGARNTAWCTSKQIQHKYKYLVNKNNILHKFMAYIKIFMLVLKPWDAIIVGCFNCKIEAMAILFMRIMNIPYILNLDGEYFVEVNNIKARLKRFLIKGAQAYLVAGERSALSLKSVVGASSVIQPYYFSSLCDMEVVRNGNGMYERENFVLVVGQYFDYKGMDVALACAKMDSSIKYKFVGMGRRTDLFIKERGPIPENVEIIPFLQKEELNWEYQHCGVMLLPTRQECWGLVVNEAASFGTPIVSTWGSGAAVEFLADGYFEYLATSGDAVSLFSCVKKCLNADNTSYSEYLKKKSKKYSIENMVSKHIKLL